MVRQKRSMKVNSLFVFWMDLWVCTPADDVERSLCRLGRKRRNKMNRHSDEQVHLWTCRTSRAVGV